MADFLKPLGLATLIALAGPVMAQDTTAETTTETTTETPAETPAEAPTEAPAAGTPTPDLDMGEAVGGEGAPAQQQVETYIDEVYGDWQRECLRLPNAEEGTPDPCQITQFLREEGNEAPVGKVSIGRLPAGQQAVAGSMVIVPLGVLLTQQITIGIDGGTPKRYPFRFCDPNGCVAQIGYTDAEVSNFKAGAKATVTVTPAAAPDQEVKLPLSLSGFTDAWNSLPVPQETAAE